MSHKFSNRVPLTARFQTNKFDSTFSTYFPMKHNSLPSIWSAFGPFGARVLDEHFLKANVRNEKTLINIYFQYSFAILLFSFTLSTHFTYFIFPIDSIVSSVLLSEVFNPGINSVLNQATSFSYILQMYYTLLCCPESSCRLNNF